MLSNQIKLMQTIRYINNNTRHAQNYIKIKQLMVSYRAFFYKMSHFQFGQLAWYCIRLAALK